ncbi:MAG: DUF362 domain-containing protein [Acidobacteria bacterium]|nr:DUF362 domain-containing protein [Acidobacteriota bacterium]
MNHPFSRRTMLGMALGAGAIGARSRAMAQNPPAAEASDKLFESAKRSTVSLIHGENRRKNVAEALTAIDEQILPVLKSRKYVVIKPNNVSTVIPLAATNADALMGIMDYLAPRFKGPVYIAESSAGNTLEGFDNFKYQTVVNEFKNREVKLVDLNKEGKYVVHPILDANLHPTPIRLAARLVDPDAFVLCSAILKTHNTVVATMSIKNMALGAPLRAAPGEKPNWNDKRKFHGGVRQSHIDIMLAAQRLKPTWGATLIDGYEGMEGNGPSSGTPVQSRVAIASTDYVAADRVGLECMGINPSWVGYLRFCSEAGLGQYDMTKIDIRGEKVAAVKKEYRLHRDIERELRWMGPMEEVPEKLG